VIRKLLLLPLVLFVLWAGCFGLSLTLLCREWSSVPVSAPDGWYRVRSHNFSCLLAEQDSAVSIVDVRGLHLLHVLRLGSLEGLWYWKNPVISCVGPELAFTWVDFDTLLIDDRQCVRGGARLAEWGSLHLQYRSDHAP
jgi:hypothetical protein